MPVSYSINNYKLGKWVNYYRTKTLNIDQYETLDNLNGWYWSELEEKWQINFELTKEYIEKNGIDFLFQSTVYKGYNIGSWVSLQRVLKRGKIDKRRGKVTIKKLSKEKTQRLESISGWIWEHDDKWYINYRIIKEYLKKHNINDITTSLTYKKTNIGGWLRSQRRILEIYENSGRLTGGLDKNKISLLKKIGVIGKSIFDLKWDKNFEVLKEFVEKNGWHSLNAGNPKKTKLITFKGLKINSFVNRERQTFTESSIKLRKRNYIYRKERLESINFPFDAELITIHKYLYFFNIFLKKNLLKSIFKTENKIFYDYYRKTQKKYLDNKIPKYLVDDFNKIKGWGWDL